MPDFPYSNPNGWQVQIGSVFVRTDVCAITISGLKTGVKLDKQEGVGRNGATIRVLGEKLPPFVIEIEAWDQAGFDVLFALCKLGRTQKGQPLAVYHPLLTEGAGIDRMIIEDVEWSDGKVSGGKLFAKLMCTAWAPPPPKAKAPASVATTPKIAGAPADLFTDTKGSGPIKALPKPPGPSSGKPTP